MNLFKRVFQFFSEHKTLSIVVISIAMLAWYFSRDSIVEPEYQLSEVSRGNLQISITATGTVEPEEVIDVGAQVAGLILSFGADKAGKPIDYGSEVDEGMVLAQIDDSLYLTDVAQTEAQLKRANADLGQAEAKRLQSERDWQRAQKIGPSDALSQSAFDSYKANAEIARANVGVAQAGIIQADAALQKAKRNLGYTIIRSPVKGVIIDRRVNIGQTVVSSLNAPSLFLIAQDLKRMQVWVSVNEADIGSIKIGQKVNFSVDAFPDQQFVGEVGKIRLNASMNQNVVSYVVEVATDNSSGKLLPYLTANVRFEIMNHENVLLVPNSALRWRPTNLEAQGTSEQTSASQVWTLDQGKPKSVPVKLGGSDGLSSEVTGEELKEGMPIIVGSVEPNAEKGSGAKNPFAPSRPARGARRW